MKQLDSKGPVGVNGSRPLARMPAQISYGGS
jgi:hypothetical protein